LSIDGGVSVVGEDTSGIKTSQCCTTVGGGGGLEDIAILLRGEPCVYYPVQRNERRRKT